MTPLRDKAIQTALIGDWNGAITTNKELLDENPKDIDALNRLALAFTVIGRVNKAKTTYQEVLKIDPLNPIALRNLKNLKTSKLTSKSASANKAFALNNNFIEESGKTKVIELINIAPVSVIQHLRTGEIVNLSIKRAKIFVLRGEKQYIGVLPDDIGRRLIRFIKSGNKYEAYLKSVNPHKVIVFLKEVKRSTRFKNHPSFLTITESNFIVKTKGGPKSELEEDNDYSPEEEEVL
ncbi:MAG TPA: tetratricopeptide repeat protein [Patescibacteria group bacterium]|nr:tetratricopeptide repeat protein [Patescibacteria group bacterium]